MSEDFEQFAEEVEDWVVDNAAKDDGMVFMKEVSGNAIARVTYGELRKLLDIVEKFKGKAQI